jgi:hypothetical protein
MYVRTPFLADGGNSYWDPLAATTLTDPGIATWEDARIRMEPGGPAAGRLIRDPGGRPVRVAMAADPDRFLTRFLAALRTGGPRTDPFEVSGSLAVRWDGNACTLNGDPPKRAGLVGVQLVNASSEPVSLFMGGARSPKGWADVVAFARAADFGDPNLALPDWVVPVQSDVMAAPGETASAYVTLPPGDLGAMCATGDWPALTLFDAGGFRVGG